MYKVFNKNNIISILIIFILIIFICICIYYVIKTKKKFIIEHFNNETILNTTGWNPGEPNSYGTWTVPEGVNQATLELWN